MKKQTQEELFIASPGACGAIKTHTGHSAAYKLLWVSAGPDAVTREPQEIRKQFPLDGAFTAAGQPYSALSELIHSEDGGAFRDIYGREVLYVLKRFPCFDFYDAMYEKRFERWFLIYTGGSVTRVKYTDETDYVEVWEDAASLEYEVWQEIEAQCWHTLPK